MPTRLAARALPPQTLPDDYATASEAIDAARQFIIDKGYAPGEAFCEVLDLRGFQVPE